MASPVSIEGRHLVHFHLRFVVLDDFSDWLTIFIIVVIIVLIISNGLFDFFVGFGPRIVIVATAGV
jgi:hypothetical protein